MVTTVSNLHLRQCTVIPTKLSIHSSGIGAHKYAQYSLQKGYPAGTRRCCQTLLGSVLQQARQRVLVPSSEPGATDDSVPTTALGPTTNSRPADHGKTAALFCAQPDRIRSPMNDFASTSPGTCGVLKGERQLPSVYATKLCLGTAGC